MTHRNVSPIFPLLLLFGLSLVLAGCPGENGSASHTGGADAAGSSGDYRQRALRAMEKGFDWLLGEQNENGSFGEIPGSHEVGEVGLTGLAIKAMALAPEPLRRKVEPAMNRAIAWLLTKQQPSGTFTTERAGLDTYRTAIAIMALRAADPKKYAGPIEKAVEFLKNLQFSEEHGLSDVPDPRKSPHYGGFGYDKAGEKPDADLSNTMFALMALKEAGVPEDSPVWKRAVVFVSRCQQKPETNDLPAIAPSLPVRIGNDGGFLYDPGLTTGKGEPRKLPDGKVAMPSYASMTYAGLMSLLYANVDKNDERVKAAVAWCEKHYTLDENYGLGSRRKPENAQQGLYYFYHVFAKAMQAYGEPTLQVNGQPRRWAEELIDKLIEKQKPEGFWRNDVADRWWEANPILCTTYCLLALEIAREEVGK